MPKGVYYRTKSIRFSLSKAQKKNKRKRCSICARFTSKSGHICPTEYDISHLHTPEAIAKRVKTINDGYKSGRLKPYWLGKQRDKETLRRLHEGHLKAIIDGKCKKKKGVRLNTGRTHFKKGVYAGKKHWNWKGGISPAKKLIWQSPEYQKWRKAVFKRDKYTCRECDKGGKLNAHHIKSIYAYPELMYVVENGVTLCVKCHRKYHKIFGYKHNYNTRWLNENRKRQNN